MTQVQWEYMVLKNVDTNQETLNNLGTEGWELVGSFLEDGKLSTGAKFYFKRPKL